MDSLHRLSIEAGTQDVIDYETISTGSVGHIAEAPERLHEWLTAEQIESLHQKFLSHTEGKLTQLELREALENFNITFTDREYKRLFLKINQNRDFKCDWDEFISYLIFGFQDDDPSTQKEALVLPISVPPTIKKSEHRSAICCITFLKPWSVKEEEEEDKSITTQDDNEGEGMYLTASKDGYVKFWSTQFEPVRHGLSQSIHLDMPTWILAIEALSDVCIVCTSSTERELRFHETVVATFWLRLVIRNLPFAVCCLSYTYHPSGNADSKLVLGDYGGNVRILEFTPFLRGPFQSKPGAALIDVHYNDVLKGKLPLIKVHEYLNIHSELLRQVQFSLRLNMLFTAAEYRNTKKYRGRASGVIVVANEEKICFRIPMGVTAFCVAEKNSLFVTGGPDMFVRIWDVYISNKPIGLLTGHNAGVVEVFVQPSEKLVYSIDYHKIIKVWHLYEYTLLQSYGDLARILSAETDLVYYYNAKARALVMGGRKLINLKCCPRIKVDLTDGNTHSQPVSVVLYNHLFRNVVTCGLDSYIIVWDPWVGRRKIIMKNCHTRVVYGQSISIEITAACFDPLEQFLLTGARDGSLKIWNYNNAVCIRNMSIADEHEVTAVIWVVERILAVGWDKIVTEFNDVEGREYGDPKKWVQFHDDDITCADVKLGEGVVTATYSGELIFWKLETGQPYRRYNVSNPIKFIELKHTKTPEQREHSSQTSINVRKYVRTSLSKSAHTDNIKRLTSTDAVPASVQALLFLQTRQMTKEHGSILVALDNGKIQIYSHHQRGGFLKEFMAVHKTGDCVLSMTSDRKNRYLFTGTAFGYIKTWHIQNYCVPDREKRKLSMPLLRLQFIFLRRERFLTRAKRMVRNQPEPMLLNSYKGHLKAVNSLVFINLPKLLLSGSHDCSCRLWTLGGRYLGTLGTPLPWLKLSAFDTMPEDQEYRMPPDIKKVASSTTIKVISGVQDDPYKNLRLTGHTQEEEAIEDFDMARYYGKALKEPILGKHFKISGKSVSEQTVVLDTSLSYIPVYSHLKIHEAQSIERPPTPPVLHRIENEEYIDYFTPDDLKDKVKKFRLDSKDDGLNVKSSAQSTKKNSRHDSADTRESTKTVSENREFSLDHGSQN